jgi:DNA-binding HxlR family transcriptional regulator
MSTAELIALFHHRWAPPALAELGRRGGVRFVELQNRLGVGRESLRRALDALIELGLARRNPGYSHPLRPEYVVTEPGRAAAASCARVLALGDEQILLRKWSVPTLAELPGQRRFSELRAALTGITPRALALALKDLETAGLIARRVIDTHPPSTIYRTTARGKRVRRALRAEAPQRAGPRSRKDP